MFVDGEGPVPCNFLILGEAPGAEEERQGRPFVGASGQLLDRAMEAAGIERGQVYITNAYKLRPPGNRNPTEDELSAHRAILIREFQEVDPHQVLLVGSVAQRVARSEGVDVVERGVWAGSPRNRVFMWVYHPAYLLYSGQPDMPVWYEWIRRFFHELPEYSEKR